MPITHLSEIEIQEYLDTNRNKEKVETHILSCQDCAILVAEYEAFYAILSEDDVPQLSVDFVSQTMKTVRQESIVLENNNGFYLYSVVSFVCAFIFMKYYLGLTFNLPKFNLPQLHNNFAEWSLVKTTIAFYHTSPSIVNILLFAGMILLFIALVDSIMSRKKLSKVSCFSI